MPTYDHGVSGLTGTIGVTILNANGTLHDARATAGITEPVAGSGVYLVAHPHPGTLLGFIFDGGAGTVGASTWDDGLTVTDAKADTTTLLSRIIGTLAAGTHTAQSGDAYASASAAAASAASADGKLTAARLAKLDGCAQAANLPTGVSVPAGWTVVTHATLDNTGAALGPVTVNGVASAGVGIMAAGVNDTVTGAGGTFSLPLPSGTHTLVFSLGGKTSVSKVVVVP